MTNFKEHDGLIFKMLEEPVPLTPDAEMPCLTRLIQDDSRMGMFNRDTKPSRLSDFYLVARIANNNIIVDEFMESDYHRFEIIGYPVVEGSADWALYQMMNGEKIINSNSIFPFILKADRIVRCGDDISWDIGHWLRVFDDTTGWQIYEKPNPEPQYKVGDWVEHKESKEQATIRRIMSYGAIEIEFAYSTESDIYQADDFHNDFRKLKPFEIVVRIGCLSGTIGKSCEPACFLMWHSSPRMGFDYSIIKLSALDKETRELVEGLLEEQDEEKLKGENND